MIKNFILNEKSIKILEIYNKYILDVNKNFTKLQIQIIIEKTFFVQIIYINIFRIIFMESKFIIIYRVKKRIIVTIYKEIKIQLY